MYPVRPARGSLDLDPAAAAEYLIIVGARDRI
jgi:hypothetical protein